MNLPHYYEDPKTLHVGSLPPRAYYLPCGGENKTDLNGVWDFGYYPCPAAVPQDFWLQASPATMPVPGVWQHNGYDQSQYTNVIYPFPFDPPHVPVDNPCGAYVRRFTVTAAQKALRQYLNFEGVDSAYYVWVNGQFIGYGQVPHCTDEYDITDAVVKGENTLAVLVLKWSDGSYLEDQDKFRYSGIFRDVYILHRPENHLRDYTVRTVCCGDYYHVSFAPVWLGQPQTVQLTLRNADGQLEVAWEGWDTADLVVSADHEWSAENPYLYELQISAAGEVINEKVGLRWVENVDGVFCVNGVPVKFRGVNRHDSSPYRGSAVTCEDMLKDLRLMKQHNINAIRTSHYPPAPAFLQMCDELGFYVIDEADQEAHGGVAAFAPCPQPHLLADDPAFFEAFVDRAAQMLQRDKNRPCVVLWSAGNESEYGRNIEGMLRYFKQHDPTRLTHYESVWNRYPEVKPYFGDLDTVSRMYPTCEEIARYLTDPTSPQKPYVLCEYSHAMGNGPGDLEAYWQTFDRFDQSCGGFIWEWCDHAVYTGEENSKAKFYYGGDSGERQHDGNFCMDGLVYPDRRPHTGLLEYKNVIRPGRVLRSREGWAIRNLLDFTDLNDYATLHWQVTAGGKLVDEGDLALPGCPPHATVPLRFDPPATVQPDSWVKFILLRKKDAWYAPAGSELGFDQYCLWDAAAESAPVTGDAPVYTEDEAGITVTGAGFAWHFSKATGLFDNMEVCGVKAEAPMQVAIWRAPTDNDRNIRRSWQQMGYDRTYTRGYTASASCAGNVVTIRSSMAVLADGVARLAKAECQWSIGPDGALTVDMQVEKETRLPALPRFGLIFTLPAALEQLTYLGYGPYESYVDKHQASWYGLFDITVTAAHEDYIRPQENGSHWHCRSVTLAGDGKQVKVTATGAPFSFNASHYTAAQLTAAAHNYQLAESGHTVLTVDYRQTGIGSNSCGPRLTGPAALTEEKFSWGFRIQFN